VALAAILSENASMSTPSPQPEGTLDVRVLTSVEACARAVLDEFKAAVRGKAQPLVSFSTGATFHPFLRLLTEEIVAGNIAPDGFLATHLDEYEGYTPDRQGSLVGELVRHCPPLAEKLRSGTFFPVPASGDAAALKVHRERLRRAGGVSLQLIGIGRNGHVAHCEPGTPFDSRFHRTDLTETTRMDARERFRPQEPPRGAVTAGLADILDAKRIVLLATGARKAPAVHAMRDGPIDPSCPASVLRRHANALVIVDTAASTLER